MVHQTNRLGDVEEIEFFSDSGGKLNSLLLVHDKQMRFIVQYTEVSVLTFKRKCSCCWYELDLIYGSFYIVHYMWSDVNDEW